jgi:anti-sigma factor RsiW
MTLGLFGRHVTRWLSAYCEGVLPAPQSSRIAAHLLACQRCRRELDLARTGVALAGRLRPTAMAAAAPAGMPSWGELGPLLEDRAPARLSLLRWAPVAALALLVVGGALWKGTARSRGGAFPATLEETALAAHRGSGLELRPDERVVRRWIAGEPVTLVEAPSPIDRPGRKRIDYRTIGDLRLASWTQDDRHYVLVSRLPGEAACTVCHTVL